MKFSKAFTLVEIMVVLMVISITSTIVFKEFLKSYDHIYDQLTKDRAQAIRNAIINVSYNNGTTQVSGFVADVKRLPKTISELIDGKECSLQNFFIQRTCLENGGQWQPILDWKGPYLVGAESGYFDGWGNPDMGDGNYGWIFDTTSLTNSIILRSLGPQSDSIASAYANYQNTPLETIYPDDWSLDLSATPIIFNVQSLPVSSMCSDGFSKTSIECISSGFIWSTGACQSKLDGQFLPVNIDLTECGQLPSVWNGELSNCTNSTYTDKASCLNNNFKWIVHSPAKCNILDVKSSLQCSAQAQWSPSYCTDNSIFTKNECLAAGAGWLGSSVMLYLQIDQGNIYFPSSNYLIQNGFLSTISFNLFETPRLAAGVHKMRLLFDTVNDKSYPPSHQEMSYQIIPRSIPVFYW